MALSTANRLRLMAAYMTAQDRDIPGPKSLLIETTNRCNLFCPMCPRTGVDNASDELPDDLLGAALSQFAALGGDHVYLYGLGEPMLDPRIFETLERCRALGLGRILSTNGTLLNARRRDALLDTGCEHVIVGMDGVSDATYGYYRKGGDLAEVTANVKALAAAKLARKLDMTLVVQFIRMPGNLHEQDAFVKAWSGVPGVDIVRLKEEDIGLPEHTLYAEDGHLRKAPCHLLWMGPMVVRHNGDIFPCYHIAEQGPPLGNLRTMTLEAAWNAEYMRSLRRLHGAQRAGADKYCASCPCVRPRVPLVLGAMAVPGTVARRVVPTIEKAAMKMRGVFTEARLPGPAGAKN